MFSSRFVTRSIVLMMVFVLAVAAVSDAQAQGQRRGRRSRSLIGLAASEQVQKELDVTSEQKTQIAKISDSYRSESRGLFQGLRDVSREERAEKFAELQAKRHEFAAAAEKKLAAVLKEDQLKRLKEIGIQVLGNRTLARDDIAKALALLKEQRAKIKGVIESERKRSRQLFQDLQSGNIERDELREKFSDLRKETNTKTLAILTKEQKEKFEKMKGEKFQLDP